MIAKTDTDEKIENLFLQQTLKRGKLVNVKIRDFESSLNETQEINRKAIRDSLQGFVFAPKMKLHRLSLGCKFESVNIIDYRTEIDIKELLRIFYADANRVVVLVRQYYYSRTAQMHKRRAHARMHASCVQ